MTILPPPPPRPKPERPTRHECQAPGCGGRPDKVYQEGTLWECPTCGRWWKLRHVASIVRPEWDWWPARWYDIPARRRIAAHETEKMHYRVPTTVGDLHWWDCHPNPNRGQP